jgi:hypothetical protein
VNAAGLKAIAALVLLVAVVPAGAAGPPKLSEAEATYRSERARCLRDASGQDRATCLKEAAAARQEARRDGLRKPQDADLSRNATQRCDAQPAADREACVQRILGAGTTRGSVQGGGLIRQTETTTR